ncbi:NUDIX hydrolase [Knoellia sp. p5-6-4]|uniref:NUDIX hydrolase n=1 Tax=unclassified Knoellia TaxID=2618719 RepID=UPI0023DA46A0|nr:NUDIX hydrolase [Knoellia sp. p5-6-4]MDF2146768.1 NUDIX hydrolase [Knoellia sp. p5-6-4]
MSDTPRHSVSVAAAIFDDTGENVLLIKRRDNGRWEPPGGVLELEETIEDGLRREVREETGAEIAVGPLTGVYKNMNLGIVALVFRSQLASKPSEESPEAAEVAWHPHSQLPDSMLEAYAARITDALAQSGPAIRAHDGASLLRQNPTQ